MLTGLEPPEDANGKCMAFDLIKSISEPLFQSNDALSKEIEQFILLPQSFRFYDSFPYLKSNYQIIGKLGEVYHAIDLRAVLYDNTEWNEQDGQVKFSLPEDIGTRVALKRIYVTSSPTRILSELNLLKSFRHPNVISLITAMRHKEQFIGVLPYVQHREFSSYYSTLSLEGICNYMIDLCSACDYIHSKGIIHRDIKPTNFLFNDITKRGVLVDFGLAQGPDPNFIQKYKPTTQKAQLSTQKYPSKHGCITNDPRPAVRANRAGTRGFRAPEVLFKSTNQTTAIDIWSVGVSLLCLLAARFPFFNSNDDAEALIEIAHVYGIEEMTLLASRLRKSFETNLPTIKGPQKYEDIISRLNPRMKKHLNSECIELIEGLLCLHPSERFTAARALETLRTWEMVLVFDD